MSDRSFIEGHPMRTSGEETKEKIERAALSVFGRSGINGASIRDIAKAAGVSQGAIYTHFASKEELAWELFSRSWAQIGLELRRHAKEQKSLRLQLRALVRYVFELYQHDPELVAFVYFSRHEHLRRVPHNLPNPYMVFRLIIAAAMAREEIPRRNVEAMTAMAAGTLIQMIDTKALGRIREDLPRLADLVAESCYRLLSK